MNAAPLTGVGHTTGISGESRSSVRATESGRNFTQVLNSVMSSCPLWGSSVGSGEEDDTIVNGDWSLALQVKHDLHRTVTCNDTLLYQHNTKMLNMSRLSP